MAYRKNSYHWPVVTVLAALFLGVTALPTSMKQWAPSYLRDAHHHFGLDLAGGTQLDFRISEQEISDQIAQLQSDIQVAETEERSAEQVASLQQQLATVEQQKESIVEAIRTVLERRINALGVSEAIITPSYFGNEKHLLVECPGVINTQECINTVGKTIKLEFKEELTEADDAFEEEVRTKAANTLRRITQSGDSLEVVGQDLGDDLGVAYIEDARYFKDAIPEGMEDLWNRQPSDQIYQHESVLSISQPDANGQPVRQDIPGIYLTQITRARTSTGRTINEATTAFAYLEESEPNLTYNTYDNRELTANIATESTEALGGMTPGELRAVAHNDGTASVLFLRSFQPGGEEMAASHILIAYKGATSASPEVVRSKEEAAALAAQVKSRIDAGENFATLAAELSDGPSGKDGGSLGTFNRDAMVPEFSAAAFALQNGEVSNVVETAFGYHIIKANSAPSTTANQASYEELVVRGDEATTRAQDIITRLQAGQVQREEDMIFTRHIFFSLQPTGWKDTALDGKHFRTATVTLDPVTNIPVVQIMFDDEGAKLFQELTAANIDKQIAIFVGGQLVSAPTVQAEISGGIAVITGMRSFDEAKQLAQDLNTGAIPAPIYLSGQRTVEATLGADALATSMKAALIGVVILMLYMIVMYRLLGVLASVALSIYAFLFYALLKLPLFLISSQYIVLTLAGMAGIILSIGMAVDANVLIFERIKEELRKGKTMQTAADTGFKRAWPSIRDGNMSTFITCAILFTIGTSIVRGFAVTLGLGVLLSMFTAIIVTRWLVKHIAK